MQILHKQGNYIQLDNRDLEVDRGGVVTLLPVITNDLIGQIFVLP